MTDIQNPFASPQSPLERVETHHPTVLAGGGRRFGTLLADYVLFTALSFFIGIVIALLFGDAGVKALKLIPDLVLGTLGISAYYLFFEGIWSRTPGKWLFGTLVLSDTGAKPSFGQIVRRTLCRFIPFEALSFLGERGWHDSISKTQVVLSKAR